MNWEHVRTAVEPTLGTPDDVTVGEYSYKCPFCGPAGRGKISHLHVNYQRGKAICHGCGYGALSLRGLMLAVLGKIPRSLNHDDGGDNAFDDFIDTILFGSQEEAAASEQAVHLPEGFTLLTKRPGDSYGSSILEYLTEDRNVPIELLMSVGVGYCPSGRYRGYAIFPVHVNGNLVTFTSRRVPRLLMNGPKVLHGSGGVSASRALFNYDNCWKGCRLLVGEGPFDAWALHQRLSEKHAAVSTMGTNLHRRQARLLAALECREIVICYDPDAPDKAVKASKSLFGIAECPVSVMTVTADPDELPDEDILASYRARVVVDPELADVG